jgi:Zn finger protein HypA/HybF involved in hydrogenase expression
MAEHVTSIPELINNMDEASKIARILHEKYLVLEASVLNSKFSDLVSILNTAKTDISEFQNIIKGKDKQISDLEFAMKFKDKLVCVGDAYYEMDGNGKPTGHANCIKCWENTYKKRTLVVKTDDPQVKVCPTCGQTYSRVETDNIKKKKFKLFNF